MSHLESKTLPILQPLIRATRQHGHLTPSEQLVLAQWTTKTACTYDLAAKHGRECYFTAADRDALATNLFLPEDTLIFAAQYEGKSLGDIVAIESHIAPTRETVSEGQQHLLDTHGYAVTFAIKHLALQIFSFRRGKHLMSQTLAFLLAVLWNDIVFQFGPRPARRSLGPHACAWTTRASRFFAKRFENAPLASL